jgi:16S rRNA processing protein RimM
LDGSVHVTRPRAELLMLGGTVRISGVEREIVRRAGTDARPIIRLAGFDDRTAAETLRGVELLVARTQAPPLENDEWWAEDLEGCDVRDGEREVLVPVIEDVVKAMDLPGRRVTIDPIPGLLD